MTIFACPRSSQQVGGHEVALAVVVVRVVGQQHAQAVADGDAGRDDEEARRRTGASWGLASLLSVCQAMSIAMTTVLPRAGRHLEGDAEEAGVVRRRSPRGAALLDPGVAVLAGDLGEVDGRLERLDLAEEEPALAVGVGPVLEQARGWSW